MYRRHQKTNFSLKGRLTTSKREQGINNARTINQKGGPQITTAK